VQPYLAFAAMLMAGLDRRAEPHRAAGPVDKDLYDLPPKSLRTFRSSSSLDEALRALETDKTS